MQQPQMQPAIQRGPSAATRWLAILLLLVAGALVYTVVRQRHAAPAPASRVSVDPRAITPRGDLAQDEQTTIELFRNTSPSVVHITSLESRPSRLNMNALDIRQGTGSGFVWDDKGHVVTNYHVIQHADHAEVTLFDNSVWRAEIVGVAPDKDLAVLKISSKTALKPIPIGTSSNLLVGQKVFAIGNPFGLDQTLTTGVISGLGREIKALMTKRPIYDVIQTDASINPGNSGGPLLDSSARLIGVNTAIYSPSGSSAGIGFAVPVDIINLIVPQLIANGRVVRSGLGIHIASDHVATQLNLEGVLIIDVPANTAAGRAGLQPTTPGPGGRWILGDIIVGVDGTPIRSSGDLFRALDQHSVGDTIELTVEHDKKRRKVAVTLQALP